MDTRSRNTAPYHDDHKTRVLDERLIYEILSVVEEIPEGNYWKPRASR
ncbi:MAG: hypothetical protein HFH55_11295 [Lachnospiraceae bacterium]|nr:hypothetical protein [Lachnospiraceae bacterium]